MLLRKRNRSVKCSKYFRGMYQLQSYWNYFSTYKSGVIEKTSVLCTNALAFLWDKEISCFAIILKLALSMWLLLVRMLFSDKRLIVDKIPSQHLSHLPWLPWKPMLLWRYNMEPFQEGTLSLRIIVTHQTMSEQEGSWICHLRKRNRVCIPSTHVEV